MRSAFTALFILFVSQTTIAQKDSVRKYLDGELRFTSRKEAVYGALAVKQGDHWMLYAAYPDTNLLLKIFFKDPDLNIKEGPFNLFHPKGIIAQSGYFLNNIPNGFWQSWYSNRQLKDSGQIINNQLTGIWKHWYENGNLKNKESYKDADKTIIPVAHDNSNLFKYNRGVLYGEQPKGVLEGMSLFCYENGNKESIVNYHNDSLVGICTFFREDGSLSSKETYNHGKVVALECYDEQGEYSGATCSVLKLPVLIHAFFNAQEYIVDQLHRNKNNDIREEGDAQINFTVTKTGKVTNLVIKSSPDAALSNHITKIFGSMPAWSPAITHNRPVDFAMHLVIPFYR